MSPNGTPQRRPVNGSECQNKKSSHVKCHQILSVQSFIARAELFHADGQTGVNLIAAFHIRGTVHRNFSRLKKSNDMEQYADIYC